MLIQKIRNEERDRRESLGRDRRDSLGREREDSELREKDTEISLLQDRIAQLEITVLELGEQNASLK